MHIPSGETIALHQYFRSKDFPIFYLQCHLLDFFFSFFSFFGLFFFSLLLYNKINDNTQGALCRVVFLFILYFFIGRSLPLLLLYGFWHNNNNKKEEKQKSFCLLLDTSWTYIYSRIVLTKKEKLQYGPLSNWYNPLENICANILQFFFFWSWKDSLPFFRSFNFFFWYVRRYDCMLVLISFLNFVVVVGDGMVNWISFQYENGWGLHNIYTKSIVQRK